MPVFVLMTKLGAATVKPLQAAGEPGTTWRRAAEERFASVRWLASYNLLGNYDALDLFDAADVETAAALALFVRAEVDGETVCWPAWARELAAPVVAPAPASPGKPSVDSGTQVVPEVRPATALPFRRVAPPGTAPADPSAYAAPATPFDAEPSLPPGVPELSLEHYASLLEELAGGAERAAVLAHYGLTADIHKQLEDFWMQRVRREPGLGARLGEARRAYLNWKAGQSRG